MYAAEDPPATKKVFAFGGRKLVVKLIQAAGVLEIAFNFFFQRLQHAGHRDQHRYPFVAKSVDNVAGLEGLLKKNSAPQKWRQIHSQKLSEDMAQRQEVKKTQRVYEAFVFQIRRDLRLEWRDIAENIAVGDHHTFWFSGGARGKNNLHCVFGADFFGIERLRRPGLERCLHLLEK